MTQQRRFTESGRPIKKTLYVVTALHVAVGFFIAVPAALSGDPLSTFLGWLIIIVALTTAVVVNKVIRLGANIEQAGRSLDGLHERVGRIEGMLRDSRDPPSKTPETTVLDLASIGQGDLSLLLAASLDRDAYPRLVTTMEEEPPAVSAERTFSSSGQAISADNAVDSEGSQHTPSLDTAGITRRDLHRQWRLSLRRDDLAACREIFAAFVDTAESATVESMRRELSHLARRTEMSLRERFSACARGHDYAGLLLIGEQICTLLTDRPIADEFRRLKPHLLRRYEQDAESQNVAELRVVR